MTFAALAERVGDTFVVRTEPLVSVVLTAADPDPGEGPGGSLVFRGGNEWLLPQGTYAVAHDVLGEGELTLLPIGRDADGVEYQSELG